MPALSAVLRRCAALRISEATFTAPLLARARPNSSLSIRSRTRSYKQRALVNSWIPKRNMASAAETDTQAAAVANESGITEQTLQKKLAAELEAQHVVVNDISGGCGQSFEAVIVSSKFEKKTTLARHRLVNGSLRQEIAAIHAWTPKCFTPEEWEKRNNS